MVSLPNSGTPPVITYSLQELFDALAHLLTDQECPRDTPLVVVTPGGVMPILALGISHGGGTPLAEQHVRTAKIITLIGPEIPATIHLEGASIGDHVPHREAPFTPGISVAEVQAMLAEPEFRRGPRISADVLREMIERRRKRGL